VFRLLHDFCSVQISAIYGNAMKDRLYCEAPDSPLRRRCQTVMYRVVVALTKLIAEHGSLDGLLAARNLPAAVARRLDAARDYLAAARRVVPPRADVPLPRLGLDLPREPADPRALARLAAAHSLDGPLGRLRAALAEFS